MQAGLIVFSLQKAGHGHFNPSLQNEVGPRVPSFLKEIGNFLWDLKLCLRDSSNRLFLKQKYTRFCNSVVLTTAIKIYNIYIKDIYIIQEAMESSAFPDNL